MHNPSDIKQAAYKATRDSQDVKMAWINIQTYLLQETPKGAAISLLGINRWDTRRALYAQIPLKATGLRHER